MPPWPGSTAVRPSICPAVSTASVLPLQIRYRGAADRVVLRTFMPRFPKRLEFERRRGDVWVLDLDTPPDVRIEYLLEIEREGKMSTVLDPGNPYTATNPFGTNSVFVGPKWNRIDWMRRDIEQGEMREIRVTSHALAARRHHFVYTPPQLAADEEAPLLVAHDGTDYVMHAGLLRCVDALIADGSIEPLRVVGLNPKRRHVHYIGNEAHASHVVDEVLPHVRARVPATGRVAVMGASLGAVASWHCAWRYPTEFDGMFLQSGTFAFAPHPELTDRMHDTIARFVSAALDEDRLGEMQVTQTCGRYESLIDWNREVAKAMAETRLDHRYVETWSGHDWGAWSGTLVDGLVHLFGTGRSAEAD